MLHRHKVRESELVAAVPASHKQYIQLRICWVPTLLLFSITPIFLFAGSEDAVGPAIGVITVVLLIVAAVTVVVIIVLVLYRRR